MLLEDNRVEHTYSNVRDSKDDGFKEAEWKNFPYNRKSDEYYTMYNIVHVTRKKKMKGIPSMLFMRFLQNTSKESAQLIFSFCP